MIWIAVALQAAIAATGAAQQDTAGPARMAVVNLPDVSDKYQRTADLEAYFEKQRTDFQQQREAQKDKLDRMAKALQEEIKPGTPEFRDRAKQIAMADAELKWFVESEQQRIEEGLKTSLRLIFDDIQAVIRDIADAKGIELVVATDRLPEFNPENPNQLRQQIMLQKVLYWDPRLDITAEVIERLNAKYKTAPPPLPTIGANPAPPADTKQKKPDANDPPKAAKKP